MCICLANIYLGRKRWILAHPTIMLTGTRGRNCSHGLRAVTLKTGRLHFWLKAGKMLVLISSVLVKRRFVISFSYGTSLLGNYTWGCEENESHLNTSWLGQFLRHTSPQFLPGKASGRTAQRDHFLRLTPNNTGTLIFLFFFLRFL